MVNRGWMWEGGMTRLTITSGWTAVSASLPVEKSQQLFSWQMGPKRLGISETHPSANTTRSLNSNPNPVWIKGCIAPAKSRLNMLGGP